MVDYVTSNDHQSYPAKGQSVVLLSAYAGTAATTTSASARVGNTGVSATITISNVTAVGGATVSLQGSSDKSNWTTLTAIASTVTTQTSYTTVFTNTTTPWAYYRVTVAANASTNTNTVVLSF